MEKEGEKKGALSSKELESSYCADHVVKYHLGRDGMGWAMVAGAASLFFLSFFWFLLFLSSSAVLRRR